MPRLTLDETSLSGQYARSAHIAAMGQRLAAAGPRTRQRVIQRYNPLAGTDDDVVEPATPQAAERQPGLVADRSHAFIRDNAPILPPSPRRRLVTTIGRGAALGVMASAGFALVLVAQSPRWSVRQHVAAKKQVAVAVADHMPEQPAKAPDSAVPAKLAQADSSKSVAPEAPPRVAEPPMPQVPPAAVPAAMPPKAAPAAPVSLPPAKPAPRPMQVQLAAAHRPRQEAQKTVHVAARQETPHSAIRAHYELPHWLTEARTTPPRTIIMSPPPHDLQAPVTQAANAPVEKPRPALPPLPRPRLIYAASAYPPPTPTHAYYGYPYPYGYYQQQPYPP